MDKAVLMNKVETYVLTKKAMDKAEEDLAKLRPELEVEAKSAGGEYGKAITLPGSSADLQVVYKEKINIHPTEEFKQKFESGFYPYIRKSQKLNVAEAVVEKAHELLKAAGLACSVSTEYVVDSKKKVASKEMDAVLKAASVVEEQTQFKVVNSKDE